MLGETVRTIRRKKNLTIREVAEKANITRSLVSQIENNKANPSINSLLAIAKAMNVSIAHFFEDQEHREIIVKADKRKKLDIKSNVTFYLLSPDQSHHSLECFYKIYAPGASSGAIHSHYGEEFGFLLKGKLEVTYEDKTYILEEGDSLVIDSRKKHCFTNITNEDAVAIWVNTPPTF